MGDSAVWRLSQSPKENTAVVRGADRVCRIVSLLGIIFADQRCNVGSLGVMVERQSQLKSTEGTILGCVKS